MINIVESLSHQHVSPVASETKPIGEGAKRVWETLSPVFQMFNIPVNYNSLFKTLQELFKLFKKQELLEESIVSDIFTLYDKDGNGTLDEHELADLIHDVVYVLYDKKLHPELADYVAKNIFPNVDRNNDGKIQKEELIKHFKSALLEQLNDVKANYNL